MISYSHTKFQALKFRRYHEKFGTLTASEALQLAIESEEIYNSLSAFDPAKRKFWQDREDLLNYAELLEMGSAA